MLSVEDWAEIRRLHRAEDLPIKVIARVLGISKNAVKAALASDGPPKYERPPLGSVVDEVEPPIREFLQAYPRMPATVISERIGWTRSVRVLSARVAELRPVYLRPDPASRTAYVAGEIAQCDLWFSAGASARRHRCSGQNTIHCFPASGQTDSISSSTASVCTSSMASDTSRRSNVQTNSPG
jgi:transposase